MATKLIQPYIDQLAVYLPPEAATFVEQNALLVTGVGLGFFFVLIILTILGTRKSSNETKSTRIITSLESTAPVSVEQSTETTTNTMEITPENVISQVSVKSEPETTVPQLESSQDSTKEGPGELIRAAVDSKAASPKKSPRKSPKRSPAKSPYKSPVVKVEDAENVENNSTPKRSSRRTTKAAEEILTPTRTRPTRTVRTPTRFTSEGTMVSTDEAFGRTRKSLGGDLASPRKRGSKVTAE